MKDHRIPTRKRGTIVDEVKSYLTKLCVENNFLILLNRGAMFASRSRASMPVRV